MPENDKTPQSFTERPTLSLASIGDTCKTKRFLATDLKKRIICLLLEIEHVCVFGGWTEKTVSWELNFIQVKRGEHERLFPLSCMYTHDSHMLPPKQPVFLLHCHLDLAPWSRLSAYSLWFCCALCRPPHSIKTQSSCENTSETTYKFNSPNLSLL